jgi:hypothetical protein
MAFLLLGMLSILHWSVELQMYVNKFLYFTYIVFMWLYMCFYIYVLLHICSIKILLSVNIGKYLSDRTICMQEATQHSAQH